VNTTARVLEGHGEVVVERSHRRRVVRSVTHAVTADTASPESAGLTFGALRPALAAVLAGAPLTFVLLGVAQRWFPGRTVAEAGAFLALWVACAAAAAWATTRHGSCDLVRDTGLAIRPVDLVIGPLVTLAIMQAHTLVVRLVLAAGGGEALGPVGGFVTPPHAQPDTFVVATMVLTALVAPVVEEVFFRGILQGALVARFRPVVAIGAQAVVAGLCHANPGLGSHTVSVVLAATAAATVLGAARRWTGRLGPGLVGHSLYQVLIAVAVLTGA
jgi:membrane protease YdiL (CAAX protease family)